MDPLADLNGRWQTAIQLCIFIFSLVLLERSVDLFLSSISHLSRIIGVPTLILGLLTAGCEWEELAVTLSAIGQHRPNLASGNIFGSAIANILGSFSLGLIFFRQATGLTDYEERPVRTSSEIIYTSILVALSALILVIGVLHLDNALLGGCLVLSFLVYLVALSTAIYRGLMQQPEDSDSDSDSDSQSEGTHDVASITSDASVATDMSHLPQESSPLLTIKNKPAPRKEGKGRLRLAGLLISGAILLSVSGFLLAYSSSALAKLWGIEETVFGLTFLSIATTLPEKLLSVYAGKRGEFGIMVANAVGSNIFLLTINLGSVMLAKQPVDAQPSDVIAVLLSAISIWLLVIFGIKRRWAGILMLAAYLGYVGAVLALRAGSKRA